MTDAGTPEAAEAVDDGWGMDALFDMSAPQPNYKALIEQGGYVEAMEGFSITFNREITDYVLRHHEIFSSNSQLDLGNVPPPIPPNVAPPQHSKYRKLLDPLFAPKRMDEQEEDITRRVNGFIDTFVDRGECNFTEEFAEIFPSSVFLGLMGLPQDELRMFLDLRDGVLHPEKEDPMAMYETEARQRIMDRTGQRIYDYFGGLVDERTARPADDV